VMGIAYGSIADEVEDFIGDNDTLQDMIAGAGGNLTDSFLATALLQLALIGGGYAVQSSQRLRSEETGQRAEPVLATPVPRWRWAVSHLVMAFGGSLAVVVAGGLGMGLAYAVTGGGAGQIPRMVGASLVQAPALWVLVGLTMALFGIVPRAVLVTWAVLVGCFTLGLLADVLDLPGWVLDLSPFEHTPSIPAADLDLVPVLLLTAVAAGLAAVGLAGLQRRDVG
jgi:ABC-2 type transport system permease protein